jgi:hypothetical protein
MTMESLLATADNPMPPVDAAWDNAFLRVESYLRAFGLESRVLLNQITATIIDEARVRSGKDLDADPVGVAMGITHDRIAAWLGRSGREVDWTSHRVKAQARLALVIADLPGRWPNQFLSADPLPPELAEAIASVKILPAPGMRVSKMAPEPLEFGLSDQDDPRLHARRIWIPLRTVVSWLLIFGFFGVAWASSH